MRESEDLKGTFRELSQADIKNQLAERRLTADEFQGLAEVPPELEWFANLTNANTRRAYRRDVQQFVDFAGIRRPEEFRLVTRSHVIAWRKVLEGQELAPATIRRKLSALASLFNYLCEANAVLQNPIQGIQRPREGSNQGKTAAISDAQALRLLEAPPEDTLKGLRDRAILSTLLYHGLRREELVKLRVRDLQEREGVLFLVVRGKGGKIRYVPAELGTVLRIRRYLEVAGHGWDDDGALFRSCARGTMSSRPLNPNSIYRNVVRRYTTEAQVDPRNFSPHCLRATAATNAIEGGSDLEQVRDWLGHANVSTTTMYDKRRHRPEDSPTFRVNFNRRKNE